MSTDTRSTANNMTPPLTPSTITQPVVQTLSSIGRVFSMLYSGETQQLQDKHYQSMTTDERAAYVNMLATIDAFLDTETRFYDFGLKGCNIFADWVETETDEAVINKLCAQVPQPRKRDRMWAGLNVGVESSRGLKEKTNETFIKMQAFSSAVNKRHPNFIAGAVDAKRAILSSALAEDSILPSFDPEIKVQEEAKIEAASSININELLSVLDDADVVVGKIIESQTPSSSSTPSDQTSPDSETDAISSDESIAAQPEEEKLVVNPKDKDSEEADNTSLEAQTESPPPVVDLTYKQMVFEMISTLEKQITFYSKDKDAVKTLEEELDNWKAKRAEIWEAEKAQFGGSFSGQTSWFSGFFGKT